MMLVRHALLFLAASGGMSSGSARAQGPIPNGSVRTGTLSFDGRATLGDFTGTTHTVTGELTGGATLELVRGFVEAPARSLVTGNGHRDTDLNKSMESDKFPTLRYELTGVLPGAARGDTVPVVLQGEFLLHGVRQAAAIPATVLLLPDGVRIQGSTHVNLKQYRIGGLTKMLGMLRMQEDIVVHIDLTFGFMEAPADAAGAPAPTRRLMAPE